jgi:hypothetical protein
MKCSIPALATVFLFATCPLYADYSVEERGSWPESWPKELEALRGTSRTFEGPLMPLLHYAIPFTKREQFEAAWPHLLMVKSKGAPIILRRGPNFWLKDSAGVCIHTPPADTRPPAPETPNGPAKVTRLEATIYIELIVDGQIVDLNRIALPPDTPIIDERFKDDPK